MMILAPANGATGTAAVEPSMFTSVTRWLVPRNSYGFTVTPG